MLHALRVPNKHRKRNRIVLAEQHSHYGCAMLHRGPLLFSLLTLSACSRGPSANEAMAAFRAAKPGVDSAPVHVRIWADGPPWFSCAEVTAKLRSRSDSA